MSWTDERVEKLQELWNEGMSAAQIAKALGGVTRNAVIGKVHRLGLSNRGPAQQPGKPPAEQKAESPVEQPAVAPDEREEAPAVGAPEPSAETAPAAPVEAEPAPAPVRAPQRDTGRREPAPMTEERLEALASLAELEKTAMRISLLELTERTCKWPIGDPTDPDFHFCGHASAPGRPYCAAHCAIAFQPMSSRRDRDRARIRI